MVANVSAFVSCGFRLRNARVTQAIAFEWKPGLTHCTRELTHPSRSSIIIPRHLQVGEAGDIATISSVRPSVCVYVAYVTTVQRCGAFQVLSVCIITRMHASALPLRCIRSDKPSLGPMQ